MKSIGIAWDKEPMQSQVSYLINALLKAPASNQLFSDADIAGSAEQCERWTLFELTRAFSLTQEGTG